MFSNSEAFNYNYNTSSYILYGCHVTYKNVNSYPFHIACLSDIIKKGRSDSGKMNFIRFYTLS